MHYLLRDVLNDYTSLRLALSSILLQAYLMY